MIAPTLIISAILVQAVTLFAWAAPQKRTPFSVIAEGARERGLTLVVLNIGVDSALQKEINADNGFQSRSDLMLFFGWIDADNDAAQWTKGFTVRITDYGRRASPSDIMTNVSSLRELKALLKPLKPEAEITARAVKVDTGRKDAKGKAVTREFPVMFDIARRAQKAKAVKENAAKADKEKVSDK